MSTIALYASQVNQMSGMFKGVQTVVTEYKDALAGLQWKASTINKSACDLEGVISNIKASTSTQVDKVEALGTFATESEEFVDEAVRIDEDAKDIINERKNDFYEEYEYLRPECEKKKEKKSVGDVIWGGIKSIGKGLKKAGEWVADHWKEIVMTVVIVIGVVIAVVAVVYSGGTALVPILTALFTAFGASAGAATTAAVVVSVTVAVVAVTSSVGSGVLNIIDTWCDMSKNTTFKRWQKGLNITSAISNGLYSVGSIFNSFKGISNSSLREFSKSWFTDSKFRNAVRGADNFGFSLKPNSSVFWTGMAEDGGEAVAQNYIKQNGGSTLESVLDEYGMRGLVDKFGWNQASASLAMKSSGAARVLIGSTPRANSVWNTCERILVNINPKITSLTEITLSGSFSTITREFTSGSFLTGMGSALESIESIFNTD